VSIGPPPSWGGFPDQNQNGRQPEQSFFLLSEIEERPWDWIEQPFLLDSTFHLLVGKKAAGKGLWLVHTAARVTRGELGRKTGVLWLAMSEDSYAVDLVPRMRAAGGELSQVVGMTGLIRLPEQQQILADRITSEIGLVVIDPLVGAMNGGLSSSSESDVRPMLQGLNRLADEQEAMVIGIRHISIKANQGEALANVLGSTAWVDVPRMVLGVFRDDEHHDMRHLFVLAGNRTSPEPVGAMFHVGGVLLDGHKQPTPKAEILGASMKDPDELLTAKGPRTDTGEAEKLLLQTLLDAPGRQMLSDLLDTYVATQTGVAVKTIQNLRWRIGSKGSGLIKSFRPPGDTTAPWTVMLTEAGRLIAEGQSVDDFATTPSPPTSSTSLLSQNSGKLGSWAVEQDPSDPSDPSTSLQIPPDPSDPSDPEQPPLLPPNAPEWEKRFWDGKE